MDKIVLHLKRFYLRFKYRRYGWSGNYPSWQKASTVCGGYDAGNILEKIKTAVLKVKNGDAVYERDAMLFDKVEYSWPLLANLLWIAGKKNNELSVLDFGGSLGTTFFQTRPYLKHLSSLSWSIVEQKDFVAAGKKAIAGDGLDFFENVDAVIQSRGTPDVLLLSCVLPYIEKPFDLLDGLTEKNIPYIIVEATYFNNQPANRLTIQKVPPVYYDASYPAWFLNYEMVLKTMAKKYKLLAEYKNDEILYLDGNLVPYKGFIMQLKTIT